MSLKKTKNLLFVLGLLIASGVSADTASVNLETTFQTIHSKVAKEVFEKYPMLFQRSCEEGWEEGLECGEIPYGKIIEGEAGRSWKTILDIKVPSQSFNGGTFPETTFPIRISRSQKGGAPVAEKLIKNPSEELKVSSYFGRDIYVRLFSQKDQLWATVCAYAPGIVVESEERVVSFGVKREVFLGFDAKVTVTTKIRIRPFEFSSIKSCAALRVEPKFIEGEFVFGPELIGIERPVFSRFKTGSIDVTVDVKGGNFLGSVVKTFASDKIKNTIRDQIESKIENKIDDMDFENGKWVDKLLKDSYQDKLTNNLAQKIKKGLRKRYAPGVNVIGERFYRQCRSAIKDLKLPSSVNSVLSADCEDLRRVEVRYFQMPGDASKLGCFTHHTRITDLDPVLKPTDSFLQACRFEHLVSVDVKPYLAPLMNCQLKAWKMKIQGGCKHELEALKQMIITTMRN